MDSKQHQHVGQHIGPNVGLVCGHLYFKQVLFTKLLQFVDFYLSFLYAVGGQDGVSCLNIVERYDSKANSWARVTPMSCRRLGLCYAILYYLK